VKPPAPEIAKHLRAGETVLWTGRPPQQLLRRSDWAWIPIGIAVAVAGWFLLNRSRPLVIRGTTIHPFVFGGAMLLGVYIAAVHPWLDARARQRTWYAVTDLRAIVVDESRRFVASWFLNAALESWLRETAGGRGTIRFGKLNVAQPKGEWTVVPDRLRTFSDIGNAAAVKRIIGEQCDRHRAFAAQGEMASSAPFVRRVDPEHDFAKDAVAPAPGDALRYAEPLRQKLKDGEVTLFVARPPGGVIFRAGDGLLIPFALLWTAFALRWEIGAVRYVCPAIVGLPFVAVGMYMLFGRFFHDAAERRRTWYTVTNRRCLIVTDGRIIETNSLYWNAIQGVVRQEHASGRATIHFELSAVGRQDRPSSGIETMRRPPGVYFERIENSDGVEAIVTANVMGL
jgi:hypothetical protein